MNNPILSIITPSFNRDKFISETLNSVISQTCENWECIVVDDGSTDNTKGIVNEYASKDDRIKLFDRDANKPKGACACRNQGVDLAQGKYLIFLDTDDIIEPFCIEQRVQVMEENSDLDFSIYPSLMFHKKLHDLGLWWNIDKKTDELTRQFHQDAICQGTGVIWKKSSFNNIGQWDEGLHLWQDIDLFFRAYIQNYKYKKLFHLPPDLHNRRLENSLSRSDFFNPAKAQSRVDVIQRAVYLLKSHNKNNHISEAKYMLAEIISGYSRSDKLKKAKSLIQWGEKETVFNQKEAEDLGLIVWLRRTKLNKLPMFSKKIYYIENKFSVKNCTLGTLPYEVV